MNNDDKKFFYKLKFIVIGDAGVGKTNIIHRFVKGEFKNEYHLTLGMDFSSYNLELDDKLFTLQLWDTAGSEKFRSITKGYYKNSICALVVYDITNERSFNSVSNWIEDCNNYTNKNIILILVGNKSDLINSRKISKEVGKDMADKNGMLFYECSALSGQNIENIFFDACKAISNNIDKGNYNNADSESLGLEKCETLNQFIVSRTFSTVSFGEKNGKKKKKKKCC